MFRVRCLIFIFCWFLSFCNDCCQGQAPYEFTIDSINDGNQKRHYPSLFNPFQQSSLENIQLFKTKVFKLIEAQNQYFELIQQKRPTTGDYEYAKFDVLLPGPDYHLPLMDNQRMISIPKPNLPSNYTQLLLSVDQHSQLHLWQFISDATIVWQSKYRWAQTTTGSEHHECIKLKSFVSRIGMDRFRLNIVALFRLKPQHQQRTSDFLLILAINLLVQNNNFVLQTNFIEEQIIKFERIPDFDLLYLSKSRVYLSLIQNSDDSNFKYELSLYQWINEKIFDKIAWQISDYILYANHVKLAVLDSGLYVICSYDTSFQQLDEYNNNQQSRYNFINIFQLIEHQQSDYLNQQSVAKLLFISSVNNVTSSPVREIHHLSSNNDFFFLVKSEDIDVYWWDGHSLIYYDTLNIEYGHPILSFVLEKLPDQPPLILSTNGHQLNLYYKVYSKFINHQLGLIVNDQFRVEQMEIFSFNQQYFIWFKFGQTDYQLSGVQYYCQFARVQSRRPETNEEMHNLDTCLIDLKERIDRGLREVKTLKRKSEDLLVITPDQPYINVDVTVHDTFQSKIVPENLVQVNVPGNVIKGERIIIHLDTISGRLDNLENRLNNTIMLKSTNQTISSPIEFLHPIRTENLVINSMDSHFYLNDINFDTYANDSLTINTDQTITSPLSFMNGLQVDDLLVNYVNRIPMGRTMSTNHTASTQFIQHGTHRYHSVELLNGTTASKINDVRLVDIYQDRPFPIQLLRGTKTFANISVGEVAIDNGVNDLDFQKFLSKIIWLDNPNIQLQRLTGNWEFNDKIWIENLSVINRINDQFDFDYFVNNTAKKNSPTLVIRTPIYFNNFVNINTNLIVNGQINNLNLQEDILMTHGDQDFTNRYHYSHPLEFESTTKFTNLTIEMMNNRFRTDDFLRRNDSSSSYTKLLRKKNFLNDLVVNGEVSISPKSRMNGIDLTELFHRLDTMVSFSTPVTAKEIIINGNATANKFNEFHWFYVWQRFSNLLLRNHPQTINIPLSYYGSLKASKLSIGYFRGYLRFPEDFIRKYNQTKEILITGEKYFENKVLASNIYLGPNGTVNNGKMNKIYQTMVRLNSTQPFDKIYGVKTFDNLIIKGNVYVNDKRLNGHLLNNTIDIINPFNEQIVNQPLFMNYIGAGLRVKVQNLTINKAVNGMNYGNFWRDAVFKPTKRYPIVELHNKHFSDGIYVHNVLTNGTINGVDLQHLMQNAITLDKNQNISSMIYFANATFSNIEHFHTINDLDRNYFDNVVRKDSDVVNINVDWLESMYGYWHVKNLNVGGNLNGYNITDIYRRTLKKHSNEKQSITAKHVFLKPIQLSNLEMKIDKVKINQVPIRNYVWLQSPTLVFNTDVIFENLKQIENLTVYGLLNRCDFDEMLSNSIKRNPHSVTFNLTGNYYSPKVIINGNVRFLSKVNAKPNMIPNLVQVDDHRSIMPNVHFINDVTVKRIYINNLINRRNLSLLLHDAVYTNRPQRISGVKTFRKPLKIIGYIDQSKGQFYIKNSFNQHNLTNLFDTTVKINGDQRPILGKKIFTGNITFGKSVYLHQGLNGYSFPDDYVLTYTNETIFGKTNFHKKVHLHRNLNANLINQVNVTRFVHDAIMINETNPRQVSSTVRFMHPIRIVNLTVHQAINDIPIDDLIRYRPDGQHSPRMIQIPGKKTFKGELIIDGTVNVQTNLINDVDLVKDIQNEWIDRRSLQKEPTNLENLNITGQLIFDDLVHAEKINIEATLNGIPVKQFNEQLIQMERDIDLYKQKVDQTLMATKREQHLFTKNYTSNFLIDLRYFKLHQVLSMAIQEFYPISDYSVYYGTRHTKALIAVIPIKSSKINCYRIENRLFQMHPNGLVKEYQMPMVWQNVSLMITQQNKTVVLVSKKQTDFCKDQYQIQNNSSYSIQFWDNFEFLSMLNGVQDLMSSRKIHQISSLLDGQQMIIKTIRVFNSGKANYLLINFKTIGSSLSGRLKLYKHFNEQLFEISIGNLSASDFDLYEFGTLILLSVAHGDLLQTNQSKIFYWNSLKENFEAYLSEPQPTFLGYQHTRIIQMFNNRLLILYSQQSSNYCNRQSLLYNGQDNYYLDLFEVTRSGPNNRLKLYQRILSHSLIKGIQFLNIDQMTTFLLAYSSSRLELYQFFGYNKFKLISEFKFPSGKIETVKYYWIENGSRLYLVIGSDRSQSWILSAVISGRLETFDIVHSTESLV